MRSAFIKFGAYLILILGILFSLVFIAGAGYVFVFYPEAIAQKRALVGTGILIGGIIILILAVAVFESMLELTRIEQKVDPEGENEERENGEGLK